MSAESAHEYPVLIAGGGLVGLSAAMFLAQHGIPSSGVERLRGGSQLPRAAFFHMRTLELFRAAGIEDEVREQSRKEFEPEGAIVLMDTLAGKQLADIHSEPQRGRRRAEPVPAAVRHPAGPRADPAPRAPKRPAPRCSTDTRSSASSRTPTASP